MKLHFRHAGLAELLDVAEKRWPLAVQTLYGQVTGPGFWLVGDQGVYLMMNGKDIENVREQPVVYADECNPKTLPFDEWYENKRVAFGGDDGAEFIKAEVVKTAVAEGHDIVIELSKTEMKIFTRRAKGVTVQ